MTTDNFIPHLGGECPVADDTLIDVKWRNDAIWYALDSARIRWSHDNRDYDIIGWRLAESSKQKKQVQCDWVLVPREIFNSFPEINVNNYSHDDVCKLNAWGCEMLLSVRLDPSQELSEPVAEIFQNKYGLPEIKVLGGIKYATTIAKYPTVKLYTHAPDSAQAILALEADRDALKAEVERLINRLELSEYGYDGIHCRDETIELLEIEIDEIEKENGKLITNKAELLEALKDIISLEHVPPNSGIARTIARSIIEKMEGKQ